MALITSSPSLSSASPLPQPPIQAVSPTDSGVPTDENHNKQCSIKLCHKCLRNRYAEKAEEVVLLSDWHCPKCRGVCNCSVCMKKRGQSPTGILAPKAKKSGFSSVSEMLNTVGAADNFNEANRPKTSADADNETLGEGLNDDMTVGNEVEGSNSRKESSKRLKVSNVHDHCKGSSDGENAQEIGVADPLNHNEAGAKPKPKRGRPKKEKAEDQESANLPLPQGADLSSVADLDLSAQSAGHVLQFLEFCGTFGEAFDLLQGRAESVVQEIVQGQDKGRCQYSSTVQLHIQLLELIQKDSGKKPTTLSLPWNENSWLEACGNCISESVVPMIMLDQPH